MHSGSWFKASLGKSNGHPGSRDIANKAFLAPVSIPVADSLAP